MLQSLVESSALAALRRLRLVGAIPPEVVLTVLQHCQRLEHLTWRLRSPRTEKVYSVSPLGLPCLVTLTVYGFEGFRSLPPVIAPHLEQIIFEGEGQYDPEYPTPTTLNLPHYKDYPPASIFHPNQAFLPALRRLYFNPRFHHQEHVVRFLLSHPFLQDLMINNPDIISMPSEDAEGLGPIIEALAPSAPPSQQSASMTTNAIPPLTSLHMNFVRVGLDWGYGESLLAALIRLQERAPKVVVHYIARPDLDVEPSKLPHFFQRCGTLRFNCMWGDSWSDCERLGDNLHQDDDDGWESEVDDYWHDYADPSPPSNAWSQWERIGDNLRQNDDDTESSRRTKAEEWLSTCNQITPIEKPT
ncbi:hypothetical protein DL93DRAFT_2154118, partial [Clavulina sp. PMI_390]